MDLFKKKWVQWLAIWLGLILVGAGLTFLLIAQELPRLAIASYTIFGLSAMAWLFWGLWCKREYRSVKLVGWYLATGLLVFYLNPLLQEMGRPGAAFALVGMWGMAVVFLIGLMLVRIILSPGTPVFGVARALIDEAIRMKVALVFIVGLLLLVPILPVVTSEQERLQYRIQAFISWSLMASSVLIGLLTIFLSCSTIAGELTSKRIFMTMTKPIARWQFLLGKWLGIVMLNILLLAVTGVAVVTFSRMLANQEAVGPLDRVAVDEQVLVARTAVSPVPPAELTFQARLEQRFNQLKAEQPERYNYEFHRMPEKDRQAIQNSIVAAWQSVAPGQSTTFIFSGLNVAKQYSEIIQLRFKPQSAGGTADEMVHLGFQFNNGPIEPHSVADANFHVRPLSVRAIDPNGNIRLTIHNIGPSVEQGGKTINFPPGDGIQVFYRVGSFEGNLVRSLVITLTKLAFLAMLGLTASTFLSFPVAVLLTMLVYCTAGGSEFLAESLRFYAGYTDAKGFWDQMVLIFQAFGENIRQGNIYDVIKLIIRLVGEAFVAITPAFGRYETVALMADGQLITWSKTIESLWRIGLLGTGLCGVIGWTIFRRRELARVTV